jgi:hypothetical protein
MIVAGFYQTGVEEIHAKVLGQSQLSRQCFGISQMLSAELRFGKCATVSRISSKEPIGAAGCCTNQRKP